MRGWQHVICDLCGDGERVFEDDDRGWLFGVQTFDGGQTFEYDAVCPPCAKGVEL